jgi:hypothetical protein
MLWLNVLNYSEACDAKFMAVNGTAAMCGLEAENWRMLLQKRKD